jgi:RND family efflux transporter MFP subunit
MYRNVLSITGVISFLLLMSCNPPKAPVNPPVPVNLFTVAAQSVVYYDRYQATTTALSQVNLLPQVQGYITAISFKEGSHVRKGEVLYEIDKRLYEANYKAAEDNLKVAQGNLTQAQQDADRYAYLNSKDAVAKQTYDHAMITLQNAKNQVQSSEQAVKTAGTNLTYSTITAPFDGTIGFSMVKLGDLVNVGQTILNTVSTDDPMAVDFLINEKQLTHFEKLKDGKYKSTDSLFTLIMPDNSFYPETGQISIIDRAVDPQTGSIRVRLVFPNGKYILRPGMSCIVRVRNQDTTPQLFVPNKAIVEQMGEFFVYVAKDTTIADTSAKKHSSESAGPVMVAVQKKVIPGATIGSNIIIKSGINEGDKIVVDGVQTLHNGSKINPFSKPVGAKKGKSDGSQGE